MIGLDDRQRIEVLEAEVLQLTRENKKANRQLQSLQSIIEKNKSVSQAQAKLSAIIQAERSKQERYMKLLLQNCPDIIMIFDEGDHLVYTTDEFLNRVHLPGVGLINGLHYTEIFSHIANPMWVESIGGAIEQAKQSRRTVTIERITDLGQYRAPRSYSAQITPMLGDDGTPMGCMVLMHDLTEILDAMEAAERANSAKSDFLATVSHEIRTPMNAIIGISDILKKTELQPAQKEHLSNIQNSSYVLLNLINDILDISKIEAGKLELVEDYFDLHKLLQLIKATFQIMFEQKRLEFVCEFDEALPHVVFGDEMRLRQVLTNVLTNAQKYTAQGTVWFRARADASGSLRFEAQDTGIGIKDEDLPRLYNAFEQLDKVRNKQVIGTGLGLAITSRLCALMHGSIDVESKYGAGSTFTITVPLKTGAEADLKQDIGASGIQFTAPSARVLLVDDIEINLVVAAAMLEGYAIRPDEAQSGKEAIRMATEGTYDLVFMDHMMPEMDGVETAHRIRALGGYAQTVPIVALTANAVSGAMEMFMENGFNDFISKPIDPAQLASCLYRWLPRALVVEDEG